MAQRDARGDSQGNTSRRLIEAAMRQVNEKLTKNDLSDAVPNPRTRPWAWTAGVPLALVVLLFVLILSTGVMEPPDRTSLHIARDQTWERNQQPERLDRWIGAAIADRTNDAVRLPPGHFRLEGDLIDTLQQSARPSDKQIHGNERTTLAISPALAELMRGPDGEPIQDAVQCTVDASCQLALDEHNLTLVNVRLRVEPAAQTEVATTQP